MKKSKLIKLVEEEIDYLQGFKDDIFMALSNVNEFKQLGMDQQGELCIDIIKLFDKYN